MKRGRASWWRLQSLETVLLVSGLSLAAQSAGDASVHHPVGGGRIIEVLSSLPPQANDADLTLEQSARRFLDSYFGVWSESNLAAMAFVEGEYADLVDFYGKPTPRQIIVDLKRKFVERWPERSYAVRPSSLRVACDAGSGTCLISGIVDWNCRSVERSADSAGVSGFTLRVAFAASGTAKVVLENGSVIARSVVP